MLLCAAEASKLVMSYVAAVCSKGAEVNQVKEQLLQSNPVLEGKSLDSSDLTRIQTRANRGVSLGRRGLPRTIIRHITHEAFLLHSDALSQSQ